MSETRDTTGAKGGVIASATPYPWPYHGAFDPQRTALIVLLDKRWRRGVLDTDHVEANLILIATQLKELGALIVGITSAPPRPGLHLEIDDEESSTRVRSLIATDEDVISSGSSAFFGGGLDILLHTRNRTDLILVGWGLEGPVHSTLRAANDRGYECLLVADASSSLDASLIKNASSMVEFSGGIFGATATTAELLTLLNNYRNS
jgi:nicotinamidase-related amidase